MGDTCAHDRCFCDPGGDENYCGTQCRAAAARHEQHPTCECGHIDCEEETARTGGVHTTGA